MSNNRIVLTGLDDLRAALQQLPSDLANEAAEIVDHTAEITKSSLIQVYPLGDTGNLRKGVRVKIERGRFAVVGTVLSTSTHAHLFEFGTQDRTTREGWRRGRSPAHNPGGLVPIAARNRRAMNQQLKALVERAGFTVTGDV